ncbi:large exoprotein [Microbacterium sp. GXS0129]|uniref:large exoprotein n=1 Tax=Microbacterium sp. GXS0129 TaxID=3377836 RepID=UPI00383B288F
MGGTVLGGGVILAIALVLWFVYLVPVWQSRSRFNATERNAVRLNQALRVLAETAENPEELQLELNARTAHEQARLARAVEAERLRSERERVRAAAAAVREQQRAEALVQKERDRVAAEQARIDKERQRSELAAARAKLIAERRASAERRARARRTTRLVATLLTVAGLGGLVAGVWQIVVSAGTGFGGLVIAGGVVAVVAGISVLQRMNRVARRAVVRSAAVDTVEAVPVATPRPAVVVPVVERVPEWQPRVLPRPLSTVTGTSAAAAQDARDAREALRRAAMEEAARQRAAEAAPVPIRPVRPEAPQRPAAASPYARMGVVSDEEIEAHVRSLLARRAAG